jgi:hypothetical protein
VDSEEVNEAQWMHKIPVTQPLQVENILDTKVAIKTRRKEYLEYLVKWKNHPIEDYTWMNVADLQKTCYFVEDLINFHPLGV